MEGLIPWQQLEDRIEPFYPKAGRGRRPYPLGVMLRVHCVQLFYNVSDPGMEDLLYEVESVRRFAGLRLSGSLPDETTILNFRHLLETQGLGMGLFEEINTHLASLGHRLKTGTIVDASIIDVDEEPQGSGIRRCTRRRRGGTSGKAHIGVDAESGLAHSLATTAANAADVTQACVLLHGDETEAWGDAYQGVDKRPENRGCDVASAGGDEAGQASPADRDGAEAAAEKRQGIGAGEGGASVRRRFGYGKVPTGDWRRTRSASRCCSGSRICHRWPLRDR